MSRTVAGRTVADFSVADYVRSIFGDGVRTEGWTLVANAGDVHILHVRIIVKPDALLDVITSLLPIVRSFAAVLIDSAGPDHGCTEINAALMVDVNAALAGVARNR